VMVLKCLLKGDNASRAAKSYENTILGVSEYPATRFNFQVKL